MRRLCEWVIGACLVSQPFCAQDVTASLVGKVQDLTGTSIPLADARLQSGSPSGEYTLQLFSPGFKKLTVRSIHLSDGEQKSIPPLRLQVGSISGCGRHA